MAEAGDGEKDDERSENEAHSKSRSKSKHAPAPGALNNSCKISLILPNFADWNTKTLSIVG